MENNFVDSGTNISIINPKITNGSMIIIGKDRAVNIITDRKFNWFQKKMLRWCFGFEVVNYREK